MESDTKENIDEQNISDEEITDECQEYLEREWDLMSQVSPLFDAYTTGDFKNFCKLIDNGESVNCADYFGRSLINTVVIDKMYVKDNKKYFDKLMSSNCSLEPFCDCPSPLVEAIRWAGDDFYYLNKLLKKSNRIDACRSWKIEDAEWTFLNPPIFDALHTDRSDVIDLVLKEYTDLKVYDCNDTPIINYLLGAQLDNLRLGSKYFSIFAKKGAPIDEFDQSGHQPIHYWAKHYNDPNILSFMLENNINIDVRDSKGFTPLITACAKFNFSAVSILVKNNANINIQNKLGMTALMTSIINLDHKTVNLLLKLKFDTSLCDNSGDNICHYFSLHCIPTKNFDLCEKIMMKNPNLLLQKNNRGKTPMDILKVTRKKTYKKLMKLNNFEERSQ